jgi:predicted phosphoribosyltransferase
MKFSHRLDAARQLLPYLRPYAGKNTIVLTIPRGAVPMAKYLAGELDASLDLLNIKKIRHPIHQEIAIGAISLEYKIIDPLFQIDPAFVASETRRLREILLEREIRYSIGMHHVPLKNKTVIIIDDGIATGNTMLAALAMVSRQNPASIVLAVPVASPEALIKLEEKVDKMICLYAPPDFHSVGEFFVSFPQVSDEDVISTLQEWNEEHKSVMSERQS